MIRFPAAVCHHWVGTILIPAARLNDVVTPPRSALDGSQFLSARERASLRIVHKAFDAWNFRDVDGYTALLDNGYIGETHRNPTRLRGPEDARRAMKASFDAFPGLHFTIEGAVATGDDVLVSWLTTPADSTPGSPCTLRRTC